MLRKTQTSISRRKFLHEETQSKTESNYMVRPPTAHAYSAMRKLRTPHLSRTNFEIGIFECKSNEQSKQKDFDEINTQLKLSKPFANLLSQIKILFEGNCAKQQRRQLASILNCLGRKIYDLHRNDARKELSLQEKCEELERKNSQIQELNGKLRRHPTKQSCKSGKISRGSLTPNNEQIIILENVRLAQLNDVYQAKMAELEDRSTKRQSEQQESLQENDQTEILRFRNRLSYLEMKLRNTEDRQKQLMTKCSSLENQLAGAKADLEIERSKHNKTKQRSDQLRQRAMMQLQDSEAHSARQTFLLYSIKKLRESNKVLLNKMLLQKNDGSTLEQQFQPMPHFQYEIDFFRSIRTVYFDTKLRGAKLHLQGVRKGQWDQMGLGADYAEYRRYEEVDLSALNYNLPTFFALIEENSGPDAANWRGKDSKNISRIFLQQVRSLLICKTNQFLYLQQQKYSRFPEFVYGWFQNFYFNSERSQIAALQSYMQKPLSQQQFYRDLMNPKLDQSWEIITFRQFLVEQHSLEEVYFYLMCQTLLYHKAGITKRLLLEGEFNLLADYSSVKMVLELILSDFQSWNLTFLTAKLREKVIIKGNVEYIDCSFFLRCLLEYYKVQRINRYKFIAKLCDEHRGDGTFTFSTFLNLINRIVDVSMDCKVGLFRMCHCVGQGKITPEVIFVVCTQELVFVRQLRLKCFYKLPLLTMKKDDENTICVQSTDRYVATVYSNMLGLLNEKAYFGNSVECFGVIQLMKTYTGLKRLFAEKVANKNSSLLRGRHFMHFIGQITNRIRMLTLHHFYALLQQQTKRKSKSSFWIQFSENELCETLSQQFQSSIDVFEKIVQQVRWKDKIYNFRLNHAARKIQRQVRKRFIAPYLQLYTIIHSELKADKK